MKQPSGSLRDEILSLLPHLRAFARSLTNNQARADDLVQDTVVKAWSNIDKFTEGTNLRAWLFTILRNIYYSDLRKRKRETEDVDGVLAARLATQPSQLDSVELQDFRRAMASLNEEQREALILTGASGFSYDEAAAICGCAVGTIKSRVNRARVRLAESLAIDSSSDIGPDAIMEAATGQHRVFR